MTQEDKELLFKYLCMALPYKVMIEYNNDGCSSKRELGLGSLHDFMCDNAECKPYLRPMSSMTVEECVEFGDIDATFDRISGIIPNVPYYFEVARPEQIDWLNSHYFDYRGLIEKGLALEASKDMYNVK